MLLLWSEQTCFQEARAAFLLETVERRDLCHRHSHNNGSICPNKQVLAVKPQAFRNSCRCLYSLNFTLLRFSLPQWIKLVGGPTSKLSHNAYTDVCKDGVFGHLFTGVCMRNLYLLEGRGNKTQHAPFPQQTLCLLQAGSLQCACSVALPALTKQHGKSLAADY